MPKRRQYQLRSREKAKLGTFSAAEILDQISAGKLTGKEEVAEEPYGQFVSIGAVPEFYDALLSKLFPGGSKPPRPPQTESDSSARVNLGVPTRVEETGEKAEALGKTAVKDPKAPQPNVDGETRALEGTARRSQTVHDSDIDALFTASPAKATEVRDPKISPEEMGEGTGGNLALNEAGGLAEPLIEAPPEELPPLEDADEPGLKAQPQRKMLRYALAGVVVMGLYFLLSGKPDSGDELSTTSAVGSVVEKQPAARDALTAQDWVKEIDELLRNDTELFISGAAELAAEGLQAFPSDFDLLWRFAYARALSSPLGKKGDEMWKPLEEALQKARVLDPQASAVHRAEAVLHMMRGNLDKARAAALSAAETNPNDPENYTVAAELNLLAKDLKGARAIATEAVERDGKLAKARLIFAEVALQQGDLETAQTQGLEGLKLSPLHPRIYLLLGAVAELQGRMADARGLYETCGRLVHLTVKSVASRCYVRLGTVQESLGRKALAQNSFKLAYHYTGSMTEELAPKLVGADLSGDKLSTLALQAELKGAYFLEQVDGLLRQGKKREALRFFRTAQLLSPKDPKLLIQLGELTEETADKFDDFRRVMLYYERAIGLAPEEPEAYIRLGLLATEQYEFERARSLLEKAYRLAPDRAETHVALGKYYYRKKDIDEALNYFLRGAKLSPSNSDILYHAGLLRLELKKGGEREAERFFYQAYLQDPKNYNALVAWLRLKTTQREKNFAMKFVRNLMEAEPENPYYHWALGEVFAAASEYRRAIPEFHKALDLDNRLSKVRMALAEALEAVGELERAVAEYRLSSLLDRRNSDGLFRAGELLHKMRKYNQAEEVGTYLASLSPSYPGVHRFLSHLHLVKKRIPEGIREMEIEVENNPENYQFMNELAELYMQFEKNDKATEVLSRVTSLPKLQKTGDFKEERIRAYLLLSRALRAQGKLDSAEGAARLAIGLDKGDPELHRELGFVYYAQHRDKEASEEFEVYLKQNPRARDAASIRTLIQKIVIER